MSGPAPEFVKNLFGSIAHGYDTANDLITFGMARRWRQELVRWSKVRTGDHVLDCATGTGDLAFAFESAVGPTGRVLGTDFCEEMLTAALGKALRKRSKVHFQPADVTKLPFAENSFDVVSIAYGIRNVNNANQAISEMYRVCKPGGRVMILETGDHQWPLLQSAYGFYFKNVVPVLGGLATGKKSAYEYLNQSSQRFPSREEFVSIINSVVPFKEVTYKSLMGGASFIYRAVK